MEKQKAELSHPSGASWRSAEPGIPGDARLHHPAIGLLELSTEVVTTAEIAAFMPGCRYGIYTSRVECADRIDVENLASMESQLERAAELLPAAELLDAIFYACTTGSAVIGPDRVASHIGRIRPGIPVFDPMSAVVAGLAAQNVRRIAIVTPYGSETNGMLAEFLASRGIELVSAITFNLMTGIEMNRLAPRDIYLAALQSNTTDAEAIFISCTGIRTSPILIDLEREIGKPVIASNQALVWQCCETLGLHRTDMDGGSLFRHRLPPRDR